MPNPGDSKEGIPVISHPIYTLEGLDSGLRQGEIITNLTQYVYSSDTENVDQYVHDFVVIATQACDLDRDHDAIIAGRDPILNGVLFLEARTAAVAKANSEWKRISQNSHTRSHFLERIPSECDLLTQGLPALVVDFRRLFTINRAEVSRQLIAETGAKRRCRLRTPYAEHLQNRMASYLQRVPLQKEHDASLLD